MRTEPNTVMDPESTRSESGPPPPMLGVDDDDDDYGEPREPVNMSDPNDPQVKGFIDSVKRLCTLDDNLKQTSSTQRSLAAEKNALRSQVTDFMVQNGINKVNYGKNEHLIVETRVSAGSLTRKTLLEALRAYFDIEGVEVTVEGAAELDEDTQRRLQEADELVRFLNETLGHKSRTLLLRERRDKKRRAPKPPKPMSIYLPIGEDAPQEGEPA